MVILQRMQQRRYTAAQWTASNDVLLQGELGIELDTTKWKLGNGTTGWNTLPYQPSTAAITAQINAVINGAPGALDTLNELAAALGNDSNFASTVTTALAGKASTGDVTAAQAYAVQRANHTGTQAASTVTGLATVATSGAYADVTGAPNAYDFRGSSKASALRYFRSQLARRESTPVDLVFIGHSLVEGEGATAMTKRGMDRLKTILRTQFQPTGITGGYGYIPVTINSSTWNLSSYVTISGGATSGAYGLGKHAYFVNASGAKVILNTIACDAVDVVYVQGGGGTFTTKVDGVANGDSKATTGSPVALKTYRVPGITAGNHSVEVDFVSGNSIICGFMVYSGDASAGGLRFWNNAQGGILSSQMLDASNVNFAALDVIPNPALVTITALANDFKTSVATATSKANLQSLVTQLRAKAPNASIVFAIEHALGSTGATIPWANYVQQYYDVAVADGNIAVFDFYQRVGTSTPPTVPGIIAVDNQHYTDAGYLMWADALAEYLRP